MDETEKWQQEYMSGHATETPQEDLPSKNNVEGLQNEMPTFSHNPQGFISNKPVLDRNNARINYLLTYNAEGLTELYLENAILNCPNGRCEGYSAILEFWKTFLEEHKPFSDALQPRMLSTPRPNLQQSTATMLSEDTADGNLVKWFYRGHLPLFSIIFNGKWIKQGNEWFISEENLMVHEAFSNGAPHQPIPPCCNLI